MKKYIYKAINKLGYNVYKKNRQEEILKKRLKKYGMKIHVKLFLSSSKYIFQFEETFKDFLLEETKEGLKVSFSGLIFKIETSEEFLILSEIFIDQEYGFRCNQDLLLIDIGANVGFSSIYFSKIENVKKIYAFEPIAESYYSALENFRVNNLSKIFKIYNFGLGNFEREEDFLFKKQAKGNCGIRGKLSPSYQNIDQYKKQKVLIKNASEILNPIFDRNKNLKIAVKMDCEGAEYEIIENLNKNKVLEKVHIIILEWHDRGALMIEEILKDNNFTIFSRNLGPISGMICGIRYEK